MLQQSDFDRIVAGFHRATLEDEHWPAATRLVDESCKVSSSQIAVVGAGGMIADEQSAFGRTYYRGEVWEEPERDYLENYALLDPRPARALALPSGQFFTSLELLDDRERRTLAVVNEFLPRYGVVEQLITRLDGPSGTDIFWALTMTTTPAEWELDHLRLLERLTPHLAHAVAVRQALLAARLLGASLEEMLTGRTAGVVYLDHGGTIVGSNASADRILRGGDGLVDRGGHLRARRQDDDAALGRLVNGALRLHAAGAPKGGAVAIRRPLAEPPFAVHVQPLSRASVTLGPSTAAVLVLIVDPAMDLRIDPRQAAQILGLTPAEGRIAASLAEGMNIREIARTTARSENTVRWQVKQAMAKTGCSRQADLVRLVLVALGPSAGAAS